MKKYIHMTPMILSAIQFPCYILVFLNFDWYFKWSPLFDHLFRDSALLLILFAIANDKWYALNRVFTIGLSAMWVINLYTIIYGQPTDLYPWTFFAIIWGIFVFCSVQALINLNEVK